MPEADSVCDEVAREICRAKGWRIISFAGGGAFKRVYRAQTTQGSQIALKVLKGKSARTAREVDALRRCTHPHIAKLLDAGVFSLDDNAYDFQVEEFLGGGSLEEHLARVPLGRAEAHQLGHALLTALIHLDELQIVHRDIKPANIMYREGGVVPVLVDFGLVRDLGKSSLTQTWVPNGPGTPFFAPPEQLNNEKELIDWRSDQFSLAVSIFFAVTGIHPYQYPEEREPGPEIIERVASRHPSRPDLHHLCASIGMRCLERMVQAWPIHRFRRPDELLREWEHQE